MAFVTLISTIVHLSLIAAKPKFTPSSAPSLSSTHSSTWGASPVLASRLPQPTISLKPNSTSASLAQTGTAAVFLDPLFKNYKEVRCPVVQDPVDCAEPPCPVKVAVKLGPCYSERPSEMKAMPSNKLIEQISEGCVLWDPQCKTGDRKAAIENFRKTGGTKDYLLGNNCFKNGTGCTGPNVREEYDRIKSWMRSQQCKDDLQQDCCERCVIGVHNVEIVYWPEPGADYSCLETIGDEVYPVDHGVTRGRQFDYWGCTTTGKDGHADIVQTAYLATNDPIEGVSWKSYVASIDRWGPQPCPVTDPAMPQQTAKAAKARRVIGGTTHRPLVVPESAVYQNGSRPSTVILGGFTYHFPSIYAHFTNLQAQDACGSTTIASTILSFRPGELSTQGHWTGAENNNPHPVATAFNFKDLPCPPRSVATIANYRPVKGEPYRPWIALPTQVLNTNPWFKLCTHGIFSGMDPPKTLAPTDAMMTPVAVAKPDKDGNVAMPADMPIPEGAEIHTKPNGINDKDDTVLLMGEGAMVKEEAGMMAPGAVEKPTPTPSPVLGADDDPTKAMDDEEKVTQDLRINADQQAKDQTEDTRPQAAAVPVNQDPSKPTIVQEQPLEDTPPETDNSPPGHKGNNNFGGLVQVMPDMAKDTKAADQSTPQVKDNTNKDQGKVTTQKDPVANQLVPNTQKDGATKDETDTSAPPEPAKQPQDQADVQDAAKPVEQDTQNDNFKFDTQPQPQTTPEASDGQVKQQTTSKDWVQENSNKPPPQVQEVKGNDQASADQPQTDEKGGASDWTAGQSTVQEQKQSQDNPAKVNPNDVAPEQMKALHDALQPGTAKEVAPVKDASPGVRIPNVDVDSSKSNQSPAEQPQQQDNDQAVANTQNTGSKDNDQTQQQGADQPNGNVPSPGAGDKDQNIKQQEGSTPQPGSETPKPINRVVLGSQTFEILPSPSPFPQAETQLPAPAPPKTIAEHVVTPVENGAVIGDKTLAAGVEAVKASGTPIDVDTPNQIHIDSTPYALPTPAPQVNANAAPSLAPPTTIAGHEVKVVDNNAVVVAGNTLALGSSTDVSGTPVSVDKSSIYFGGTVYALPKQDFPPAPAQPTTIANHIITPLANNAVVIASHTLAPASSAIMISGTPISVDNKNNIYIASSSYALPTGPKQEVEPAQAQPTTIANHIITPLANNAVVIASQTLAPGSSAITISGTPISVDNKNNIYIASSSYALAAPLPPSRSNPAATTIAGHAVQPVVDGISIAGTTLTVGGAITTSDPSGGSSTVISLGSSSLIVGTSSVAYHTVETLPTSGGSGSGALDKHSMGGFGKGSATPLGVGNEAWRSTGVVSGPSTSAGGGAGQGGGGEATSMTGAAGPGGGRSASGTPLTAGARKLRSWLDVGMGMIMGFFWLLISNS